MISNELKSIHIDLEKGIYLMNGEEMKMAPFMQIQFINDEWSLEERKPELCSLKIIPRPQDIPMKEIQTMEFRSGRAALILPVISIILAITSIILLYL